VPELRFDPVLCEWVIISPQRQERTFLPPDDFCPLCPTRPGRTETEIPEPTYDIAVFENRFPSLSRDAARVSSEKGARSAAGKGVCEVVCYTPRHDTTLSRLPVERIRRLIEVWQDRYRELGSLPGIRYVLIFENRGKEIGVTLTHPHGQIYAFPFVPPKPQREIASARRYFKAHGSCLFCDIAKREKRAARRIVCENAQYLAFVPYWAHWPYEVHLYPKFHASHIGCLSQAQIRLLAQILKRLLPKYDRLFGFSLPYIMVLHQAPTTRTDDDTYHFHFEFYPPHRGQNRLKYLAGCESGAGTFINDTVPEEKARELRDA